MPTQRILTQENDYFSFDIGIHIEAQVCTCVCIGGCGITNEFTEISQHFIDIHILKVNRT